MEMLNHKEPLIMIVEDGFYSIPSVVGTPLGVQARHHLELNPHVIRVDDKYGNPLWCRPPVSRETSDCVARTPGPWEILLDALEEISEMSAYTDGEHYAPRIAREALAAIAKAQ